MVNYVSAGLATRRAAFAMALCALTLAAAPAAALDKVRVIDAQKGFWDTTLLAFGVDKGIFKDAGLDVDILWSDGGADAQQAVISGSMDIAYQTGTLGVVTAWEKGAPLAIMAASATGATDYLWYVRKDSPLKSMDDVDGKTIAYSRPGSSQHLMITQLLNVKKAKATLVSVGNAPAALTAVMSGQADVGFMVPPFNSEMIKKGDIRILFTGRDIPGVPEQTVRVIAGNATWVEKNTDVAKRFVGALHKTLDWAYSTDEALKMWADIHKLTLDQAREARDASYPRSMLEPAKVSGLDLTVSQALELKRMAKPFTDDQKKNLLKWVAVLNQ